VNWDDYTEITTLADGDTALVHDVSEPTVGEKMKRITWANIKATLKTYFDTLYLAITAKASGADVTTGTDDDKYVTAKAIADAGGLGGGGGVGQNDVINGEMRIAQRGTSFTAATVPINSDGTKLLDRWILLSEGNDIVDVTQSTVAPAGFTNSAKLEVETANKQFGFLHIIENKDAIKYAGGVASLQFQARMAAADDNTHSLKAVLLSWSGTADAPTIDVVNAWGATPTYVANWTAENSPASLTLTTSFQTFEIENIPVDTASMANLAIFIFCDQTDGAVDDAIYLSAVKLENGATCTDFVSRPVAQEQTMCERECEVISSASGGDAATYGVGQCKSTTVALNSLRFRTLKRKVPTVTLSALSDWAFFNAAISAFCPWTSMESMSGRTTEAGAMFDVTCSGGGLGGAGTATLMAPNGGTTAARIYIECGF